MRDRNRSASDHQYWLSRAQLTALAVTTLSVAVLGFFVGLMVGRRTQPEAEAEAVARLVEPEVEQDALMDLLARVESAAARQIPEAEAAPMRFMEHLVVDEVPLSKPVEKPEVEPEPIEIEQDVTPPPEAPPKEPEAAEGESVYTPPQEGWSVQIAAYTSAEEANDRVSALRAEGYKAWRAEALVRGRTWYRVRIGGHNSKDVAQEAANSLAERLGSDDLMVARIE